MVSGGVIQKFGLIASSDTVVYAAGGNGGTYNGTTASAVSGGQVAATVNGLDNKGGGGGGATGNANNQGAGGDGIVILSIPTASYSGTFSGGDGSGGNLTATTSGDNTILSFLDSGTYTA